MGLVVQHDNNPTLVDEDYAGDENDFVSFITLKAGLRTDEEITVVLFYTQIYIASNFLKRYIYICS